MSQGENLKILLLAIILYYQRMGGANKKIVLHIQCLFFIEWYLPYFPSDLGLLIVYMYGCSGLFSCFHGSPRLNGQLNGAFDKGLIRDGAPMAAFMHSPWSKYVSVVELSVCLTLSCLSYSFNITK